MFFNRTGLIGTSNTVFALNYFGNEVKRKTPLSGQFDCLCFL